MATVIAPGQVKRQDGTVVSAKNGEWFDAQQYWDGTLSNPGVINSLSNQQGAGQAVSSEVNRQSDQAQGLKPGTIDSFIAKQNNQYLPSGVSGSSYNAGVPGGSGAGVGFSAPEALNLPKLYDQLYANSGIKDLENEYSAKEKEFIEAKGKINDNPWLSEATRMGRVAKLETLFGERTANLKNDIATKKADIETKLNLETKQFDINSQSAQQALNQFNVLLEMGALEGASGEDIANITRSTGLSSSAIYSAINAQKQKNIQTSIMQYDDGTNQGFAVVNSQTGEIISRQVIGASKPSSSGGTGGLTSAQLRSATSSARKALSEIDNEINPDKLLSLPEYQQVVERIMIETGLDMSSADDLATQSMVDLGYKKWKW